MTAHTSSFHSLPECLGKLATKPRWVGWRWETRPGKAKPTKPPRQASGALAENDEPATWATAAEILAAAPARRFEGLGLQLLNLRGFAALDLDKVRDPETGALLPWAAEAASCGSYAEVTPSGTGLRILGRVEPGTPRRHRKFHHPGGGEIEFYVDTDSGRYITVTGLRLEAAPDALHPIDHLVERLWAEVQPKSEEQPKSEGFGFDPGPGPGGTVREFSDLPGWLQDCIAHGRTGDQSADFQAAVNSLYVQVDFATALRFFQAHPSGPASKYSERLEDELRRSWGKAAASSRTTNREAPPKEAPRASRFMRVSELDGLPVPPREWTVPEMIPEGTVTSLGGDGGTGKSLMAAQLGVAVTSGERWLGREVKAGGVLYLSAEDDLAELHRRLADIVEAEGIGLGDLDRFTIRSLAGEDALLAHDTPRGLVATPLYAEVDAQAATIADLRVILFDTSADLYPANENDRAKVRQFIGLLRGLAIRHRCAVVLLSHPSLTGLASGSGTSGSTAWNNSVRSRLYLDRIKDGDHEPDRDQRRLTTMKANYGQIGEEIMVRWVRGVFHAQEVSPWSGLDRMAATAKAERVFLSLLDEFTEQGRFVSPSPSTTYAPAMFSAHPRAEGMTKRALRGAMEALFSRGAIRVSQHGRGASKRDHIARDEGRDHGS